jgi:hypothetical protein
MTYNVTLLLNIVQLLIIYFIFHTFDNYILATECTSKTFHLCNSVIYNVKEN